MAEAIADKSDIKLKLIIDDLNDVLNSHFLLP